MKPKVINNNVRQKISWMGKQYNPEIERPFKAKTAVFYRKCIYGALSLELGNFVLVSNMDNAEPDLVSGCDIAQIVHMYEILDDPDIIDPYRAIVQWYSRPAALPRNIINDENYVFDFDKEIIEDSRFSPDISIETIFGLCRVMIINPTSIASDVVQKATTKLPLFVARYRLVQTPGVKRMHLRPIIVEESSPRKRKSVSNHNHTTAGKNAQIQLDTEEIEAAQMVLADKKWIVKTVGDHSSRKTIAQITDSLNQVGLSDEENVSPTKISRLNRTRRKSGTVRRNLNASLQCESPSSSDAEILNYSIVKDETIQTPEIKIKLRLSEQQKTTNGDKRVMRKRSTHEEDEVTVTPLSISKSLKSNTPKHDVSDSPITRPRRKSILKTPISKANDPSTPKRSIQLSNIVEEYYESSKIVSEIVTDTPKRSSSVSRHPKTPRSVCERRDVRTSNADSAGKRKHTPNKLVRPFLQDRVIPVEISPDNQLALARERLHVSTVPQTLPCRDQEYEGIYNFIEGKIIDNCGGCMYISGVPGTGKTATTSAVIRALKVQSDEGNLSKFDFVEINGMRLTEPRQAYVHIYRQLTGKTLAWEQAYNLLDKRFTTKAPRRISTILLVDELDVLCNKRQDVVYNLLNWPTTTTAQLIVITIANTMDLPERLLMGKISSRLGLTRLTFQPYNFRQLQEIVMTRLKGMSAFDSEAIQLVARKVAAVSGDARRALDICRRAAELADEQVAKTGKHEKVGMMHVQRALTEMITSAKVQTIKSCSQIEQLFLQAITAEVARTGIEECNFLSVYSQFESLAAFTGVTPPNPGRTIAICNRLGASRLLICENSRNDIFQKILLNISADDVHYALQLSSQI